MNARDINGLLDFVKSDLADDEENIDQMIPAYFKVTVDRMKFTSIGIVQGAYLVICFNWQVNAAAKKCNVKNESQVSRAVKDIREKWKEINEKEDLLCELVTLKPKQMAVVRELEATSVDPLVEKGRSGWEKYDLDSIEID